MSDTLHINGTLRISIDDGMHFQVSSMLLKGLEHHTGPKGYSGDYPTYWVEGGSGGGFMLLNVFGDLEQCYPSTRTEIVNWIKRHTIGMDITQGFIQMELDNHIPQCVMYNTATKKWEDLVRIGEGIK